MGNVQTGSLLQTGVEIETMHWAEHEFRFQFHINKLCNERFFIISWSRKRGHFFVQRSSTSLMLFKLSYKLSD